MENIKSQLKTISDLDKSTWDVVCFGDVVREAKEVLKDSLSEETSYIVGLEHLVSLDIHIRTWGDASDGKTFTKRFSKGQVLFGRRRAYQRKAVLAAFDGICSGDIIVMEAIENKFVSRLLPFLVHSDGFYEWAVSTSAGSLSPRTKFKSLSEYKFRLPPKEIQEKLAELLWAVDETGESLMLAKERAESYKQVTTKELLSSGLEHSEFKMTEVGRIPEEWEVVELSKVATISTGNSAPQKPELYKNGKYPFCRTSDIGSVHISEELKDISDYLNDDGINGLHLFKKGTILLPKSGASTFLNHRVILGIDSYVSSHLATIVANEKRIFTKILFDILRSIDAKDLTNNPDYPSLRTGSLKEILIALPSLKEQKSIVEIIERIDKSLDCIKKSQKNVRDLRELLINSIF